MLASAKIKTAFLDITRGGLPFFLGGVRSKTASAPLVAVTFPKVGKVYVRPRQSDFSTLRQVFRDEEYGLPDQVASAVHTAYRQMLSEGKTPVIIDAGANIGAASIWFHDKFPDAKIIGIEPDRHTVALAQKNTARFANIEVIEAAIGGEVGFVSVVPASQAWAVQTERSTDGCPVVTVKELLAGVPDGQLLIVKIDIEGFESDVFAGDVSWLDEVEIVYIEPHDWMLPGAGTSRSFQKAFGDRDFEIHLRGENIVYVRSAA